MCINRDCQAGCAGVTQTAYNILDALLSSRKDNGNGKHYSSIKKSGSKKPEKIPFTVDIQLLNDIFKSIHNW